MRVGVRVRAAGLGLGAEGGGGFEVAHRRAVPPLLGLDRVTGLGAHGVHCRTVRAPRLGKAARGLRRLLLARGDNALVRLG